LKGYTEIALKLIANDRIDLNHANMLHFTALRSAIEGGEPMILRSLISSPRFNPRFHNAIGVLNLSIAERKVDLTKILLESPMFEIDVTCHDRRTNLTMPDILALTRSLPDPATADDRTTERHREADRQRMMSDYALTSDLRGLIVDHYESRAVIMSALTNPTAQNPRAAWKLLEKARAVGSARIIP
jgi:hypothetical protein